MNDQPAVSPVPYHADLLTLGFGTTALMWAVGWLARMPGVDLPGPFVAVGMFGVLLAGGLWTGRLTGRGWRGGALAGVVTASLNLLIVLSLVSKDQTEHLPFSPLSVPGTLAGMAALMAAAAAVGARAPRAPSQPGDWIGRFALVTAGATALLLAAGGLVTGREAGLSVPDWPQSYGYNMFLYPLTRMTGNIYYEHTHRLYGVLVGITTITLAVLVLRTESRRWVRRAAATAVLAVILQGVMGGLRVSLAAAGDGVEVAQAMHETTISDLLRVVHGVFGQVFFGLVVLVAAATSATWRDVGDRTAVEGPNERRLTAAFIATLMLQLVLGALVRHLKMDVTLHISVGVTVALFGAIVGMRAYAVRGTTSPGLRRAGLIVVNLIGLQLLLGIAALVGITLSPASRPTLLDALASTAHQTNGALLLGGAVWLSALTYRALAPAPPQVVAATV